MSTTESDPGQTETQENTPAVQRGSGIEAEDGRTPQALWAHLRHELRTPLNAIIGYSEMLLGDANGLSLADYVSDLNQILSAGQELLEIVNDLLDPNQVASDDVVFNLESPLGGSRRLHRHHRGSITRAHRCVYDQPRDPSLKL